jgi:hypothetical protein
VLPDLHEIGLAEATLLHLVSAQPGPVEPMPDLANWVRHFEAAIPKVELALKRGDPVKWIYELARVRHVDIVVVSGIPNGADWDFERVSSPLRTLGIPILYLPDTEITVSLSENVLIAVRSPDTLESAGPALKEWFGPVPISAVRVTQTGPDSVAQNDGVNLETVVEIDDVATTLLHQAERSGASLLTILADESSADGDTARGVPVVKPLIESAHCPVLIWPTP